MGRWTVHKHHPNEKFFFVTDADTCVISNLTKSEADAIADAHNAELARVKAESLRVVPIGDNPVLAKDVPKLRKFTDNNGAWFRLERWEASE